MPSNTLLEVSVRHYTLQCRIFAWLRSFCKSSDLVRGKLLRRSRGKLTLACQHLPTGFQAVFTLCLPGGKQARQHRPSLRTFLGARSSADFAGDHQRTKTTLG